MIQIIDRVYSTLLDGLVLLGANPVACASIGFLQTVALWFVALAAFHAAAQMIFLLVLRRRSRPIDDARIHRVFGACLAAAGLRNVSLRSAPAGFGPAFTAGVIRPVVYVDPRLTAELDDAEVEAVLLHELAHVIRHDSLVARAGAVAMTVVTPVVLQAFVVAAFFTSGVLHFGFRNALALVALSLALLWVARRIVAAPLRQHAELCCDAHAVALGADPVALASAIVTAARLRRALATRTFGPAFLPCADATEARVLRLVQSSGTHPLAIDRVLRAASVTLLLLCALYVHDFHRRERAPVEFKPVAASRLATAAGRREGRPRRRRRRRSSPAGRRRVQRPRAG